VLLWGCCFYCRLACVAEADFSPTGCGPEALSKPFSLLQSPKSLLVSQKTPQVPPLAEGPVLVQRRLRLGHLGASDRLQDVNKEAELVEMIGGERDTSRSSAPAAGRLNSTSSTPGPPTFIQLGSILYEHKGHAVASVQLPHATFSASASPLTDASSAQALPELAGTQAQLDSAADVKSRGVGMDTGLTYSTSSGTGVAQPAGGSESAVAGVASNWIPTHLSSVTNSSTPHWKALVDATRPEAASLEVPRKEQSLIFVGSVMLSLLPFVFLVGLVWSGASWVRLRNGRLATDLRKQAEAVCLSTGRDIQNMFVTDAGGRLASNATSSGVLMRLQGRVVAEAGSSLTAPLSCQPCVLYSASVSHHRRDDDVHKPPIAFHSAGIDFQIQLSDDPEIRLTVHSHDVNLFDVVGGRSSHERTFAEAPDSWRGFVLAHASAGLDTSAHFAKSAGLGADGSLLDFHERSLLRGAAVTCIGEVVRDRGGGLNMYPWRPRAPNADHGNFNEFIARDLAGEPSGEGAAWPQRVCQKLWGRNLSRREAVKSDPSISALAGSVLVSDDPSLMIKEECLGYCCGRLQQHLCNCQSLSSPCCLGRCRRRRPEQDGWLEEAVASMP